LRAAATNFLALPDWMLGGLLAISLALLAVVWRRREPTTWLLVAIAAVFPVGYLAYWGNTLMASGAEGIGPQYYIPLFPVLAVLLTTAIARVSTHRRTIAVVVCAAGVALSATVLPGKIGAQRDLTATYQRWQHPLARASKHAALVFVPHGDDPYLLTDLPFLANDQDGSRKPLYAADLGAANVGLVATRSDLRPYVLTPELQPGDDLFRPTIVLKPLTLLRGRDITVHLHIRNPGDRAVVTAYVQTDGHFETRVLDTDSKRGKSYDVDWVLTAPQTPVDGKIAMDRLAGTVTTGVGFAPSAVLDVRADLYERRFLYRVVGFWKASQLQMLTPGFEYHRWTIAKPAWVAENIERVLTESHAAS
ncbi:MAG TPA: hypothetical protein VHP57_10040, partial [Acidimicrobiia bacterium]|nr:hypothetical protein [Acidimicrobiia bacterium]